MIYHLLLCFVTLIFDVFASIRVAPDEKDLQIALLRQQLRILERKAKPESRLSRPEKLMLVTLTIRLKSQTRRFHERLRETVLLVQHGTVHCRDVLGGVLHDYYRRSARLFPRMKFFHPTG